MQTGWARQARNRIRNSKHVLSQNQYVHGMYRLEMKETWYKNDVLGTHQYVQVSDSESMYF